MPPDRDVRAERADARDRIIDGPGREVVVSVVIPTHDRLPYLREAVASLRAQTLPEWELIVVDDGSADGTREYLAGLSDRRIRSVHVERSGYPGAVRNWGIEVARGEYVAFLDSDDVWEPGKLATQVAAHRERPECGWSYTALTRVDAEGRELHDPGIGTWRALEGWVLEDLLRLRVLADTPTVMVRLELLLEVGGFDETLSRAEEYDLWFRLGMRSPVLAIPERLTRIRVHAGSWSADRVSTHRCWVRVYGKAETMVEGGRLRRLCRREAARHRYRLAGRLAEAGRRGEALREWLRAFPALPASRQGWWILLVDVGLRAVVPRRATDDGEPDKPVPGTDGAEPDEPARGTDDGEPDNPVRGTDGRAG